MNTILWIVGFFLLIAGAHALDRSFNSMKADVKAIRQMLEEKGY